MIYDIDEEAMARVAQAGCGVVVLKQQTKETANMGEKRTPAAWSVIRVCDNTQVFVTGDRTAANDYCEYKTNCDNCCHAVVPLYRTPEGESAAATVYSPNCESVVTDAYGPIDNGPTDRVSRALSDAERQAIKRAASRLDYSDGANDDSCCAAILRLMLERLA